MITRSSDDDIFIPTFFFSFASFWASRRRLARQGDKSSILTKTVGRNEAYPRSKCTASCIGPGSWDCVFAPRSCISLLSFRPVFCFFRLCLSACHSSLGMPRSTCQTSCSRCFFFSFSKGACVGARGTSPPGALSKSGGRLTRVKTKTVNPCSLR